MLRFAAIIVLALSLLGSRWSHAQSALVPAIEEELSEIMQSLQLRLEYHDRIIMLRGWKEKSEADADISSIHLRLRPIFAREAICIVEDNWLEPGTDIYGRFWWRTQNRSFYYWLAHSDSDCALTRAEIPEGAVRIDDLLPTDTVVAIMRNAEELLRQVRDFPVFWQSIGSREADWQLSAISISPRVDDALGLIYSARLEVPGVDSGPAPLFTLEGNEIQVHSVGSWGRGGQL